MTGTASPPPAPVHNLTRRLGTLTAPTPPAGGRVELPGPLDAYRRLTHLLLRGPLGVVLTIAVLGAASAWYSRGGLALASAWVLLSGSYCLLNFWHCRETHCVVTGLGWTPLGLLGFAIAAVPATGLSWHEWWELEVAAYLVILVAGFTLQYVVASRTGRRFLKRATPRVDAETGVTPKIC